MKKTFKSILSVMLVLSMIMGMSGICAVSAAEDAQTQTEDRGAPNADVSILKPLTLTADEHNYMVWPSGDATVDRPLQVVMNFKANETMEEAAAGAFADFKCDFYLTFTGLAEGSIVSDGCYLAGNYGSFGWIVIPADGLELEDGVEYPVMAAYDANLKYAQDICGSVKDFTAAIYVAPEILEANPDFAVSLALKMTNPEDETDVITVGEPAVFNAKALGLSADVPAVEDDGLANAANADVIEDARAELLALGVTEADAADATATIDITIASTPDENGKIVYNVAPTLAAGGKSVKMSTFAEALTFRLPVLATETKTAANVYHDGALMGTYDIVEAEGQKFVEVSSADFSEFAVEPVEVDRGAPNADVSILKPLTLTADEHNYMVWPNGDATVDRPLQVVMNFKANETMEEAAAGAFADFKCDFYLTFTGLANGSIVSDGCYLAGNYGSFGWIVIPADGLELEDGVEYPVMAAYDANLKYAQDICGSVKDFTAAIYIAPEILEANPDFAVSLALKMTNPEDETDVITVGKPAVFNAKALGLSADVPAVEDDGLANAANADVIEDARAELLSLGVTADEVADATATIDITIASTPDENGKIVYNVAPTLAAGGKSVKMSSFAEALTFRLPVLATETKTAANVYHDGALMGTYDIIDADGQKFVEVSSADFSEYAVEPVEVETYAAKIGDTGYDSFVEAYNAAVGGDTITLYEDVYLTGKFYIAKAITIDGNGNSIIADANAIWYTVSGKLNIKNYKTHLIGVNSDNVTLKNITLDCNNNAAGINIYCAQNVVFDNVEIVNATKGMAALTVNGSTLTVKNALAVSGHSIAMDISNGDGVTSDLGVTVEEGTTFDLADKIVKFASVAELDMTEAVNAEGEPYFAAKDVAYLYTENQINSRTTAYGNGLTLLSDVTVNRNLKLSGGTLDLNGNNLTVADGYVVEVSGKVTIAGEGEFNADATLTKASATLTAPENINVSSTAGDVIYKDGAYVVFKLAEFDGTTMTLGASLSLDFAINTANLNGTDNYAVLTHTYADGRTETVTVPQSEWTVYSGTVYTIHFNGLAAKQMNDNVTVTVYNAADEAVSVTLTDSIIAYATRMLDSDEVKANAELMTVYVDMLNYGAAAQEQFGYDVENLANRNLTDEQKAYATTAVETADNRVKGTGYVGSTLTLENVIELDLVFADNKIGSDYSALYAIVTYTDHYGNAKEIRIEGTDFIEYGSIMCQVSVTGMAIADFRSVVDCTIYNADGEVLASASDSVESYANRNAASLGAIVDTIVKFGASSYNYFH